MTSDRNRLEKRFADFSDEELRKRWAAGHLTAEAQTVAATEATSRGLALEPYRSQDEPDDPVDLANPAHPDQQRDNDEYLGDWVSVSRNLTPLEAQILCDFLSARGVPVTAGNADTVRTGWLWERAAGGASVHVPKSLLQQARSLLAERRLGSFSIDESFDPGEAALPKDET